MSKGQGGGAKKGVPHLWLRKRPYEGCYNCFVSIVTKHKGHTVTLTYEDFLAIVAQGKCHYCGTPLQWAMYNARDGGVKRPWQIDRVDNTQEYTKENSVPCCKDCNQGKHTKSLTEFYAWISRLYHNLKEKNIVA